MKEVITVQCGPASCLQGKEFWKYVQRDDILFAGERPRLLAMDWKPNLSWGMAADDSPLVTWQGNTETHQVENIDSWLIDFTWTLAPKNIVGLHPEVDPLEEIEDKVRLLAEACDLVQGYHFIGDTALASISAGAASCILDITPKVPIILTSLRTGTLADEARLFNQLTDLSNILQLPCLNSSDFLISAAIDCLSAAYRVDATDMTDFLRPVMPWGQGNLADLRMMRPEGERSFGPGGALLSAVSHSCVYNPEDGVHGLSGEVDVAIAISSGLEGYLLDLMPQSTLDEQQGLQSLLERVRSWGEFAFASSV